MKSNSRTIHALSRRIVAAGLGVILTLVGCQAMHDAETRAKADQAKGDSTHPAPLQPTTPPPPVGAAAAATPAAAPPPPPPILPFDDAVSKAAHTVLGSAAAPAAAPALIVIDPLIDGVSGYQSKSTQTIQEHIARIVKQDFPQYTVGRITPESLKQNPRILVGTFTAVNGQMKTTGQREAYRFCLVMGDLSTGKIVAKSVARARLEDVDATPTAVFGEAPVWTEDPSVQSYIATCQASKVGDPIKPEYIEGLLAAALISEAGDAYDAGQYAEALSLYTTARKSPAGDQLRVYNGRYLCLVKLGRREEATQAFRELVDYGIRRKRLAVKFLFQPGSVRFVSINNVSVSYPMWLQQIANEADATKVCMQITGHTSPTGPAALNDNLSLMRAEYIQTRLEEDDATLRKRLVAAGAGSRENLIGTGRDDASDALDRRVELKPIDPCS